jgi:hypothetical protein
MINLDMTSDRDAQSEGGRLIKAGTTVEYVCHVVRAVRVRLVDGSEEIVDPNVFPQLRS